MGIKVAKFGGSSVADGIQLRKIKEIIEADSDRKYIVVSAPGKRFDGDNKITDLLYLCGTHMEHNLPYDQLFQVVTDRFTAVKVNLGVDVDIDAEFAVIRENMRKGCSADYLASRGEYLNALLVAAFLGYDFVDTAGLIKFDGKGRLLLEETDEALRAELASHERAVIPGFYGTNAETGRVRTFSRGGSDITGALVARAVKADIYENWTDVSGLLMADPAIVKDPLTVPVITYKELREMAYMGAAVMHEDAIRPAARVEVPINIRNTNRPADNGTMIVKNADYYNSPLDISGISGKSGYTAIALEKTGLNDNPKYRTDILRIFAGRGIRIRNLLSGIDSLNIIVGDRLTPECAGELTADIKKAVEPDSIAVNEGLSIVAIIGRDLSTVPAIAVRVLQALANKKINIKLIDHGSGKMNMMVGVSDEDADMAIQAIYNEFSRKGGRL